MPGQISPERPLGLGIKASGQIGNDVTNNRVMGMQVSLIMGMHKLILTSSCKAAAYMKNIFRGRIGSVG